MKFVFKKNLIAAALVPVFGFPLAATAQSGASDQSQARQTQQGGQSQQQAQQQQQQQQQQNIRDMRATEVIGATVRDQQGQDIGDVQDLIVDAGNQRVDYAILAFGGMLGFGEKLFAYPMDRFQATASGDEKELRLNVSQQELENAPGFDRSNWPTFGMGGYRGEVDKHFGRTAKAGGDLVRMSELLDTQVSDSSGSEVGQINDVVVSVTNGQVRFVALEPSDDLNMGDRLVMLPMNAIRATNEQQFQQSGSSDDTVRQSGGAMVDPQQLDQSGDSQQSQQSDRAEQAEQAREDANAQQQQQMDATGGSGTTGSTGGMSGSSDTSGGQATGQPQREGGQQQQQQQAEDGDLMLVLSIPQNQLQNARSFPQDQWPDINSRSFQSDVDRYVAAFPSGSTATGGQDPAGSGAAGSGQQDPQQQQQQQQQSEQQQQSSSGSSGDRMQGSGSSGGQGQSSGGAAQPDVPPQSQGDEPTAGLAYEKPAGMGFPPGSERQESPPQWAPSPQN